jgi:putative peptidoglycan lipid II flippase
VLLGILLAPVAIPLIAPGFSGDKRELTILLVQIMFPGVGLLVLSAWALGILNSHGRFFLSYASPVAMNVVMIAALLGFGPGLFETDGGQARLATVLAWASVWGSVAQLVVQLPTLWRLERRMRFRLAVGDPNVRTVLLNFLPVFIGRGVVQISAYVDGILASLVAGGAVAVLGYAQVIAMLPVSLFGMSVSAAELPAMSRESGNAAAVNDALRGRLRDGLNRIAFYVVPCAAAFLALGDVIGALLYQTGRFTRSDVVWLWGVLAGSAVGLLAGTLGRLYASTWYALRDPKRPLRYAVVRVVLTALLGAVSALWGPRWLGIDARWGVAGLTASAGVAAWVEFALLRRSIHRRIGHEAFAARAVLRLWLCAALALLPATAVRFAVATERPLLLGFLALPLFAVAYLVAAAALGVDEVRHVRDRISRVLGGA